MIRAAAALVAALVFLTGPPDITPDITPARVTEDSAEWDCRYDGNRICGPGNHQGVPVGRYGGP